MNLLFIDLETTGLFCDRHAILDLCMVETTRKGEEVWRVNSKIKPTKYQLELADEKALQVNGYSEEKWKDAREFYRVADEISDQLKKKDKKVIPIGWNVTFDIGFINQRMLLQPWLYHHPLDLMSMVWHEDVCVVYDQTVKYWQGQIIEERPSLSKAYRMVTGKEMVNSHSAEGDVNACIEIYMQLLAMRC